MDKDKVTRAAIYARVSTADKGQDPAMQTEPLRTYCLRQDWEYLVYIDELSGAQGKHRPALEAMMQACRAGLVDVVLVWKLDRLSRSVQDFVNLVQELDRLKIRFISTTQGIDTDQSNPGARLFMQILAAFAEFERELIRERINAGLAKRKASGAKMGGDFKLVDMDRARRLIGLGHSLRETARRLEVGVNTLRRRLGKGCN